MRILAWMFLFVSVFSSAVFAAGLKCGESEGVLVDAASASQPYFTFTVVSGHNKYVIKYSAQKEFIHISCQKITNDAYVFLINHTCGGTGCAEYNYGIIDAKSGSVLLVPSEDHKNNKKTAEKLLNRPLHKSEWLENKQDIYMRSNLELG